jgi:hypothetical protein
MQYSTDIQVPDEIREAVRKIENWAARITPRHDWAIGGICCRRAAEKLMMEKEHLDNELKKAHIRIEQLKKNNKYYE